jgi:5-formyltetrahydrofolate cyclo-ligase
MSQPDHKAELRALARAARQALDAEHCVQAAEKVAEHLLALPELIGVATVLGYAANAEEIDPRPALDALRERGCLIALPRVESPGVLGLHAYSHGDELETGAFGISQPLESAPRVAVETVDAAVVPGVAFDLSGCRLGYGGGYYDRLLGQLREDCLRIGLAYDEQVLDELPRAEHDEHMDAVVTPTRVIEARRA